MKKEYRMLFSLLSVFAFSFCAVLMAEYIQKKEITSVVEFLFSKVGVVLFCAAILFFLTMALIYITRSVFAGSAISGIFVYLISCVEYFKYTISGSHLVIADLGFVSNFGAISGFADIKPEAHLVRALAALILFLVCMSRVKMPHPKAVSRSVAGSVICVLVILMLVSPTGATERTYSLLEFDTAPALTTQGMNERFENDGFLGFLSQNATEQLAAGLRRPDAYSKEFMEGLISSEFSTGDEKKPNVVIIASESFSDLRRFSKDIVPDSAYAAFDKAAELGIKGKCVLPTFGGYTVRSEFELIFGLPALSMSNPPSPHSMLDEDKEQNTTVGIYNKNGYMTTYIHSFVGDFYNRNEMYARYGFRRLIFADEFDGERDLFRRYTDDRAVMKKIEDVLKADAEPSFVFAMTMQNHQPYVDEGGDISDELGYYLEGIENSSEALLEFFEWLKTFDEETIVLFVGDHLPFFTPQGGVYEKLGAYEGETLSLYEQEYVAFSNTRRLTLSDDKVSLFYLPHLVADCAELSYGPFTATMLDIMKRLPVYSVANASERDEVLDTITYDRTLGECWCK